MSLTYTDIFCGAGGSSIGLTGAGLQLRLAANHWDRAIETHSANFPDAEHLCADVNNYDMRRLPRTDVLWASPICTEVSPAGGRKRRQRAEPDLFDHGPVSQAGFERTRATFHDVIRATEVHRYLAVIVENVVEVVEQWELFDWWVQGMCQLRPGYNVQYVSVSSAHVGGEGNPHAPQWRDRLYLVFTRAGVPLPDVAPRPAAWCVECAEDVAAVQTWKNPRRRRVGKYRQQYVYRCPNTSCRHALLEPYVLPAAAAIDWSDLGQRIGDRARPLAPKTIARIEAGLRQFAQPITLEAAGNTFERRPGVRTWPVHDAPLTTLTGTASKGLACPPFLSALRSARPRNLSAAGEPLATQMASGGNHALVCPPVMVAVNHDDDHGRAYPADAAPLPPRTTKIGDGLVSPPMLVPAGGTWRDDPAPTDLPMGARTARETDALVCPPFVTMLRANNRPTGLDEPLATVATGRHHYVTVPSGAFYVRNFGHTEPRHLVRSVGDPLGVITARDHHALVVPYYRTGRAKPTSVPLDTVTGHDRFALVDVAELVEDCLFRMLQPREHLRAQRFPDTYVVHGNKGEQTMQAGNAVSANVAQWLGERLAAVLGAAA